MSKPGNHSSSPSFLAVLHSLLAVLARYIWSLPGKLLLIAITSVLIIEVLIFLPSAASFRTQWLSDKAERAHLAVLAADGRMDLSDDFTMELLDSAGAVGIARFYEGVNELVLGTDASLNIVEANLVNSSIVRSILDMCDTYFAPPGRYVAITAIPQSRPDERIRVIVEEAPLKEALNGFSQRILILSLIISFFTGGLIYLALLFLLVRPMRRLAKSMTAFQQDPADPERTITASGRIDEIGEAQRALSAMQSDVRSAFKQRERLAALGGAVAKINHDLRNVLSSAQLISDRLAMSQDERVANMGHRLVRAVDRGVRLAQDVLDYGRAEERDPELIPVNLQNALDDAAGDAFASIGATDWENTVSPDVVVKADPDHLHRIFLNLFRNAIQAMIDREHRNLSVSAVLSDGFVDIQITDTGPGIPDRVKSTLFAPFSVTASKGGSGLGLSIARELCQAMSGDVALQSTGPDGTVFTVRLPLV